jgi:hypothetical protein
MPLARMKPGLQRKAVALIAALRSFADVLVREFTRREQPQIAKDQVARAKAPERRRAKFWTTALAEVRESRRRCAMRSWPNLGTS